MKIKDVKKELYDRIVDVYCGEGGAFPSDIGELEVEEFIA